MGAPAHSHVRGNVVVLDCSNVRDYGKPRVCTYERVRTCARCTIAFRGSIRGLSLRRAAPELSIDRLLSTKSSRRARTCSRRDVFRALPLRPIPGHYLNNFVLGSARDPSMILTIYLFNRASDLTHRVLIVLLILKCMQNVTLRQLNCILQTLAGKLTFLQCRMLRVNYPLTNSPLSMIYCVSECW